MRKAFAIFLILQAADLATTVGAMALGGSEQSPLVQHLMSVGPLAGLVLAKLLAVAIGVVCLIGGKSRALRLANVYFVCIVVWNVSVVVRLALI
jgi:hypothetical protein